MYTKGEEGVAIILRGEKKECNDPEGFDSGFTKKAPRGGGGGLIRNWAFTAGVKEKGKVDSTDLTL